MYAIRVTTRPDRRGTRAARCRPLGARSAPRRARRARAAELRSALDRRTSSAPSASGERAGIVARDDEPSVSDDVLDAGGIRTDDRQAAGHRLERRHGQSLVARGEGVDVGRREERAHAARDPAPTRRRGGRPRARSAVDAVRPPPRPPRSRPARGDRRAGSCRRTASPGVEQDVEALALELQLPVPGDDRGGRRDTRAPLAPRHAVDRRQTPTVDRVRDVRDAVGGQAVAGADALELASRSHDEPRARDGSTSGRMGRSSRLTW